jgi:hypothetical protein
MIAPGCKQIFTATRKTEENNDIIRNITTTQTKQIRIIGQHFNFYQFNTFSIILYKRQRHVTPDVNIGQCVDKTTEKQR